MEDRELLEAAAKAAGIALKPHPNRSITGLHWIKATGGNWGPLIDSGQALELAVKLMMSVDITEHEESTYVYAGPSPRVWAMEMWRGDRDAATRRAIVRAAASLAKEQA